MYSFYAQQTRNDIVICFIFSSLVSVSLKSVSIHVVSINGRDVANSIQ